MRRICAIVCGALGLLLCGTAMAEDLGECEQFRGQGAGSSSFPPYQVELKLFECAGMSQDVAVLDVMDQDLLVLNARYKTLPELLEKLTTSDKPRKYSELTTAARLAKLKVLLDAFYRP